jgi:integrase/recombinase XerD
MLRQLFRATTPSYWDFIEKETTDEIIFRTIKTRNRLILEFMARGGTRIGEVLKLTSRDISDRKLILRDPKSGRENEIFLFQNELSKG